MVRMPVRSQLTYKVDIPHKVPQYGPSGKFFVAHDRHTFRFTGRFVHDLLFFHLGLGGRLSHRRVGILEAHRELVKELEVGRGLARELGGRPGRLLVVVSVRPARGDGDDGRFGPPAVVRGGGIGRGGGMVAGITVRVALVGIVFVVSPSPRSTRPGERSDALHDALSDPSGVPGNPLLFRSAAGRGNGCGGVQRGAGGIGGNRVVDVEQLDAARVVAIVVGIVAAGIAGTIVGTIANAIVGAIAGTIADTSAAIAANANANAPVIVGTADNGSRQGLAMFPIRFSAVVSPRFAAVPVFLWESETLPNALLLFARTHSGSFRLLRVLFVIGRRHAVLFNSGEDGLFWCQLLSCC